MSYKISISKQALRELEKLPTKINQKISSAIDQLSKQPRPIGCKKIKGERDYIWRIRIGDYRVLYAIDDKVQIIDVRKIGHRKNIYE